MRAQFAGLGAAAQQAQSQLDQKRAQSDHQPFVEERSSVRPQQAQSNNAEHQNYHAADYSAKETEWAHVHKGHW